MEISNPATVYLENYTPPAFLISEVDIDIDIRDDFTTVKTSLTVARNPESPLPQSTLILDGDELELLNVWLNGRVLVESAYELDEEHLYIKDVPATFVLTTEVRISPEGNTQLMGLYASSNGYFTQCEAEGFRRITFFPDRPDVMARYTTTIHADQAECPILLSNGNLEGSGTDADGRHWAHWVDPHPKPSYLFAAVAADLDRLQDDFVTASGRKVKLLVYVEPGKLDQCDFAMEALKHAMRWDEGKYGLELDLDQYMIVAVSDFNMGAMENKGLNIFNTKYVLARSDTATDHDFMMLDRVIAHEYFHNWTGNRVTCRDWFQLSLKEGLTVFRDQEYGGDRYSEAVQRIQEVRSLRATQFPEDAGPMAHPVRPERYMEISNFYTATVYNKGAEVVRMIHTLLGQKRFRQGMDLYFERHDGEAVRTEEFVSAMQDASGVDLHQFQRWYGQAGTPVVSVRGEYDAGRKNYILDFKQHCPATPEQEEKQPFHIPIKLGLIDPSGQGLSLRLKDEPQSFGTSHVFSFTEPEMTLTFTGIEKPPVPSLLRDFSAPVRLQFDYDTEALAHLMVYDGDPFNRWEAGQRLALNVLLEGISSHRQGRDIIFPDVFVEACARVLADGGDDPAFAAEALVLPSAVYIAEQLDEVDPEAIFVVRTGLRRHLATCLKTELENGYRQFVVAGDYNPDPESAGRRSLRNLCLSYLMELETHEIRSWAFDQVNNANNMTDAIAALGALANNDCKERRDALLGFYGTWQKEPLVLDKWFAVQAGSRLPDTLNDVRHLMDHPAFDASNPNRFRSLVGVFCHGNHVRFHAVDGAGYEFAAEQVVALDSANPHLAARLARAFDRWRSFDTTRQEHACRALEHIRNTPKLSKDTLEVVIRLLD